MIFAKEECERIEMEDIFSCFQLSIRGAVVSQNRSQKREGSKKEGGLWSNGRGKKYSGFCRRGKSKWVGVEDR